MKILVITEQRQGKWNNTSFETLAAAQQIASALSGTVSAVVIGKGLDSLANDLAAKNVTEVLQVEHDLLESYTPDGFCVALKRVIESAHTRPRFVSSYLSSPGFCAQARRHARQGNDRRLHRLSQ